MTEKRPWMWRDRPGFLVARLVGAAALLLALGRHPSSYYAALRWLICGVSVFGVLRSQAHWKWIFGIIAVVFNPVAPLYLGRGAWHFVDVATALVFLASIVMLRLRQDD